MTVEIEQLMSLLCVLHSINTPTDRTSNNNTHRSNTGGNSSSNTKSIYATTTKQPITTFSSTTSIPFEIFTNTKLSAKLSTQLHDPLTVVSRCMPPWCGLVMRECPFLFPFELRRMYFFTTGLPPQQSFKYLVKHEEEQAGKRSSGRSTGTRSSLPSDRTNKAIKLTIARDQTCLINTIVAMEEYARRARDLAVVPLLEVRFVNEVGTGEGPTREFCDLVARELQRRDLQLWRHESQMEKDNVKEDEKQGAGAKKPVVNGVGNDGNGSRHSGGGQATKNTATEKDTTSYVNAPFGLFPAPSHDVHAHMGGGMEGETSPFDSLYQTYVFLGRMFAFALVSDRTMDMTLSAPLRRAILHGGGSNLSSSSDLTRGVGSNINDTVTTASTALTSSVKEALAILENVDPVMCRHLTRFQHIAEERASMIAAGCVIDEKHPSLCVQGAPLRCCAWILHFQERTSLS